MVAGGEDPLILLRNLIATLRPRSRRDHNEATRCWQEMLTLLAEHADYRQAAAATVLALFADRE